MAQKKTNLILLILTIIIITACSSEELVSTKVSSTKIELQSLNQSNETANLTLANPIPKDFLDICPFNQKIEVVEFADKLACIDGDELNIAIKNIGFDDINSIVLEADGKTYESQINPLSPDKTRKYRFQTTKDTKITLTPKGIFNNKDYICDDSAITLTIKLEPCST